MSTSFTNESLSEGTPHRPTRSRSHSARSRFLHRSLVAGIALVAAGALVAGCGGDDDDNSSSGTSPSTSSAPSASNSNNTAPTTGGSQSNGTTVKTASTSLGTILVDQEGRTLYMFGRDKPNQSECTGACASAWPVDETQGAPVAGSGVQASMLRTAQRSDGTIQVTFDSHPLYTFSGDSKAGDVNGEGVNAFGAVWYVMSPSGKAITSSSSGSSGSGSSSIPGY
jgi:predicted lipoprotein with Yx(FWY)xxD motif